MMRKIFHLALVAVISAGLSAEDRLAGQKVTAQIVEPGTNPTTDQSVLNLDEVVRVALAKNPAVLSASHAVLAGRAKVPQASALPDPTFGVGWMGNPRPFSVQTGDPSSYRSVSAMQMRLFLANAASVGRLPGRKSTPPSGTWKQFAGAWSPM